MSFSDGRIPSLPNFEFFDFVRGEMGERYRSRGLITNSEDW